MHKSHFRMRERSQNRKVHHNLDNKFQCLLRTERQPLQAISTPASLAGVLNGICNALDCQIGNVVSFISLPWNDAKGLAAIAVKAEVFGLYTFCSEGVVAENDELLGSLEMYCSVPRSPSATEFQRIERAAYLAAIAIQCDNEAAPEANCERNAIRPARPSARMASFYELAFSAQIRTSAGNQQAWISTAPLGNSRWFFG
jgi:hypothetical protein